MKKKIVMPNLQRKHTMKKKIIVAGFPGIGKSTATKLLRDLGHNVSDSDSSGFPKDNFPANYIESIKASTADIIFCIKS